MRISAITLTQKEPRKCGTIHGTASMSRRKAQNTARSKARRLIA
jgi:hypothetical protein